jgi:hypothetical protein
MTLCTVIELTIDESPPDFARRRHSSATTSQRSMWEILAFRCGVAAQMGVRRAQAFSQVVNMVEQMPLRVLRSGAAEIRADAPIGHSAVGDRPIFYRQAAQERKAAAIEHLGAQPVEHRAERRQREVRAADVGQVEPARLNRPHRSVELGNLRRRQAVRPLCLSLAHLDASPGRWAFDQQPRRHGSRRVHDPVLWRGHGLTSCNSSLRPKTVPVDKGPIDFEAKAGLVGKMQVTAA